MDDLVVHRKDKYALEILLKQVFEFLAALAIDVPGFAGRRGMKLRLDRRRTNDQHTLGSQRVAQIGQIGMLIRAYNVFDDIEAVEAVVLDRKSVV